MQGVSWTDMDLIEKLLPAFTETEPAFLKILRNIAKYVQHKFCLKPILIVLRIFSLSFHQ
jgi:hypothetical protein